MTEDELRQMAAAFIRGSEALRTDPADSDEADWDPEPTTDEVAYAFLGETIRRGDALLAWRLVCEVLDQVPDDQLAHYTVGSLEDLVRLRGPELVDEIEAKARAEDRFRWALARIWLTHGVMPEAVLARIVRASGDEIEPVSAGHPYQRLNRGS